MKQKFPLIPTLCTAGAMALLIGLGVWQLQRLEWKTALLQKLDAEYEKDASNIILDPAQLDDPHEFRRGTLVGSYEFDRQIFWVPRVFNKLAGRDILTPLKLKDGSYMLVDRGWVPQDWHMADEKTQKPDTEIRVTGMVRKLSNRNPFTPPNAPAKNQWYHPDPADYAAYYKIGHMHADILFREGADVDGQYPLPQQSRPEIANNHLQYAGFWFAMAGILAVIYVFRFLRPQFSAND